MDAHSTINPKQELKCFLDKILPNNQNVKFLFIMCNKRREHRAFTDTNLMAEEALCLDEMGYDVYFACASFLNEEYQDTDGKRRQRTAKNATAAGSFWLDIDCGEGKDYETQKQALKAIKKFCLACDLPKPLLVNSGGGLHVYWPLDRAVPKDDWLPVAGRLKELTHNSAIRLYADDTRTADISSVLRPIGTHNWKPKYDGPIVKIVQDVEPVDFDYFVSKISDAITKYIAVHDAKFAPNEPEIEGCIQTDELQKMLKYISADVDRGSGSIFNQGKATAYWAGVIWGIRSEGDHFKEIAREWSQTSERFRDGSGFEHAWDEYNPNHASSIGIGSVIKLAQHFGYKSDFGFGQNKFDQQTQQNTSSTDDTWPNPKPLRAELPPVPPFDLKMLPNVFVPYVKDVSELMGQPMDFFGAPLMIVSAAALGSRWVVCPKQLDLSWRESAVLWGGVVARSGSKKTPSIAKVQNPINDIQKSLDMKFSLALDQYNLEKSCFDNMSKSQKEKTGAVFAKNPPEHERILVNDTTYQKLAKIMSVSPDGIISIADELVGLMKGWEANGQEAARQFYLTAWNGNQPYSVDRMSRESDRIDRCFLCLLGGVQPPVLADYVMQAKLGGAGDDGLIQRFQMLVYPDINIDQVDVDRPADVIAEKEMRKAVIGLRNLSPDSETGFCKQEEGINIIQFDEVAGQAFTKLRRKIEKKALREDTDPMMASHLSKMPAVIAKLSMIIHLLDTGIGLINSQALSKAARWAVYLRKHTERIHASATPVEAGSVRKLAQHILDGKMGVDFYARQIERKHWSGLKDEKIVAEALKALVEYNWLRSDVISTGGRPTVHYAVNPKIKGMSL